MTDEHDSFDEWLAHQHVDNLPPRADTFARIARSARRRRWAKAAGAGTAALVVVVGLAATIQFGLRPSPIAGPTPVGPSSTAIPSPQASATEQTREPDSSASSTPNVPAGSGSGSSGNRCHTGDLALTQQTAPGGGAAGSYGELLVLRNTSSRSCTLFGYPGVSFVGGGSGQQVNDPFVRDVGTPVVVTVAPGGAAHVLLLFGHPDAFPAGSCQAVQVDGYRVYPPDETTAVFVAAPQQACSVKGVGVPRVGVVQPGTGA